MIAKIPAYVLGGGVTGLGITRNLGTNGIPVVCVLEKPDSAMYSKYCGEHVIIPDVKRNASYLRKFFANSQRQKQGGVIFPTSDASSLFLSELKDELSRFYHPIVPNIEAAKVLIEKKNFYPSLEKYNVPHPSTVFLSSEDQVRKIRYDLNYPLFIKPSISQGFSKIFNKKGFLAKNPDDLTKYYAILVKHNIEGLAQEVIPGPDSNIFGVAGYFDGCSIPKAFFAYHRLRGWPVAFGTSTLVESVSISKVRAMKDTISSYLQKIGYHGIMETEFKVDSRDNIPKVIEVNARSWWQNTLPTKCGINILFLAYLDALNQKSRYTESYVDGMRWMNFFDDLLALTQSLPSPKSYLNSTKKIKDWAYYAPDDILPWFIRNFETIKEIVDVLNASIKG